MRVPLTINDFLHRARAIYPDRVAITDEPTAIDSLGAYTYRDLYRRTRAIAAGLDGLGVPPGERVAIVSPNSARLLELLYALPAHGRVAVPINFRLTEPEVAYIVEHCGASMLLIDPELDEPLSDVKAPQRYVLGRESDAALLDFSREPQPWAHPDEDATATINYTSGTTARPKGVQLTHRSIYLHTLTFGWHMGVSDSDAYLHTLPLFHVNGWGFPYAHAAMGVPQVILRKVDGAEILRRVHQHGITIMNGAPAVWQAVLDAAQDWDGEIPGRGKVRLAVAGAPPPSRMIARIETELGWEFNQVYGLTETSPILTVNRSRPEHHSLPVAERAQLLARAGAPTIGVQLRISDSGEVLARSNVVLEGYWDNPAATQDAIEDGWFHTGDGGILDDDGYLHISDRKKDVIITGGENVSSIEVEDRLFHHPAVGEVAVIGVPDEKWGETVKAIVVLAPEATASEQELIGFCRDGLAHFKCPTSVEFRESIPRTATGKIQKFKLREPYWAGRDRAVN